MCAYGTAFWSDLHGKLYCEVQGEIVSYWGEEGSTPSLLSTSKDGMLPSQAPRMTWIATSSAYNITIYTTLYSSRKEWTTLVICQREALLLHSTLELAGLSPG